MSEIASFNIPVIKRASIPDSDLECADVLAIYPPLEASDGSKYVVFRYLAPSSSSGILSDGEVFAIEYNDYNSVPWSDEEEDEEDELWRMMTL